MLKLKLQHFGHLMRRTVSFKRPWCWERLKAGGKGDDRGWDGWMASSTQWTWVWVSSRSWWWTGRPGMLQSMESQRVGHDWATELNWNNNVMHKLFHVWVSASKDIFLDVKLLGHKIYTPFVILQIVQICFSCGPYQFTLPSPNMNGSDLSVFDTSA